VSKKDWFKKFFEFFHLLNAEEKDCLWDYLTALRGCDFDVSDLKYNLTGRLRAFLFKETDDFWGMVVTHDKITVDEVTKILEVFRVCCKAASKQELTGLQHYLAHCRYAVLALKASGKRVELLEKFCLEATAVVDYHA